MNPPSFILTRRVWLSYVACLLAYEATLEGMVFYQWVSP